ncbi:MAG: ParA family protein [Leptospiraceae bacterium]|nr:ParA family protein [Leptospiraceae bacterium]
MRKIVINNQKGGSGKTTTAVNISAALAEKGKKVLLVDLDPGASATIWLLGNERQIPDKDLFDVGSSSESLEDLVTPTQVKNMDIIPFNPVRNKNTKKLKDNPSRSQILKNKFRHIDDDLYDYIIFDCGPGLSLTTVNALAAANELLIPVTTHSLTLYGVISLLETMESVQVKINPDLHITGILPCRVDPNLRHNMEILELLIERFGVLVYNTYIREDIKIAECPSFFQTIFQYDSKSTGAVDYRALAAEIIEQESKK